MITKQLLFTSLFLVLFSAQAQSNYDFEIDRNLKKILLKHKEFVSIPNLPENKVHMFKNITWVSRELNKLNFKVNVLASETLPVLFAEKNIDKDLKTVLFYFHLDGQPVNPKMWNQEDPFIPVLKERNEEGVFEEIDWNNLDKKIVDDWRIFGRAAADDKAPIIMLLSALEILQNQKTKPTFNIKIVFDLEEEYGSYGFLSTIEKYKKIYASDYFIIMDGPAHSSNKPTLTFGCRGIATCTITTYGSKLPQHSGHFGNYVSNPVFTLSHLLSSMKSESGKVLIKDYYKGITISDAVHEVLKNVPDNTEEMNRSLFIHTSENVGNNYQEALQYP
ncbi:MAG: acetylornithine deacetylase/succinyl-diaminopimelate desuccinylase-like protein, partial [Polaribacter sp.]